MSGWAEAPAAGVVSSPDWGATTSALYGAWFTGTVAPGGADPEAPTGVVFSPYRQYAPFVMIVVGAIVVGSVLLGLRKAKRAPQLPPLEERLARLAEQKRAEREAGVGVAGPGAVDGGAGSPAASGRGAGVRAAAAQSGAAPPLRLAGGGAEAEDAQRALEDLARDAEELGERLAVAMDARAARLEGLIREADIKIRRLEELRRGEAVPAGPHDVGGRAALRPEGRAAARAQGTPDAREAGGLGALGASAGAAPRSAPVASLDDEADPVQRQVFALADQGMAALEIARRVNQPTGQVELMLALRGR